MWRIREIARLLREKFQLALIKSLTWKNFITLSLTAKPLQTVN